MKLTREEFSDLFELTVAGTMAQAFTHAQIVPTKIQWEQLKGIREFTMRDIGEIGFVTGTQLNIHLQAMAQDEEIEE